MDTKLTLEDCVKQKIHDNKISTCITKDHANCSGCNELVKPSSMESFANDTFKFENISEAVFVKSEVEDIDVKSEPLMWEKVDIKETVITDEVQNNFKDKILQNCDLQQHIIHTGEKPFACDMCGYKSTSKDCLNAHVRTHTKPFKCTVCNYRYSQLSNLQQHMRIHRERKPYHCEIGYLKFNHKNTPSNPMRVDTSEKPLMADYKLINDAVFKHMEIFTNHLNCTECDYKCSQEDDLQQHLRIHMEERVHVCKICDLKFSWKDNLEKHMTVHTGEKPYACERCDYKSLHNYQLQAHMRTHTEKKSFACEGSSKQRQRQNMKNQTEPKLFICDVCGYKCSQKTDIIIHIRKHKAEKPFADGLSNYKSLQGKSLNDHIKKYAGEGEQNFMLLGQSVTAVKDEPTVQHENIKDTVSIKNEVDDMDVTSEPLLQEEVDIKEEITTSDCYMSIMFK